MKKILERTSEMTKTFANNNLFARALFEFLNAWSLSASNFFVMKQK